MLSNFGIYWKKMCCGGGYTHNNFKYFFINLGSVFLYMHSQLPTCRGVKWIKMMKKMKQIGVYPSPANRNVRVYVSVYVHVWEKILRNQIFPPGGKNAHLRLKAPDYTPRGYMKFIKNFQEVMQTLLKFYREK